MPKVLNMGVGKRGEVWWETNFPANRNIWIPIPVEQLGSLKKGDKIRVTIKKEVVK